MSDLIRPLRAITKYSAGDIKRLASKAADEIERLTGLLEDKQYIQTLADYNKGHLSHAGWLAARQKQPPKALTTTALKSHE